MDLRRERKKATGAFGIIMTLLAVCIALIACGLYARASVLNYRDDGIFENIENRDSRAKKDNSSLLSYLTALLPEDEFSYSIKNELVFESGEEAGEILLSNPAENRYLLALVLKLDSTGETILMTGYLLPGETITDISFDKALPKGEYTITANICAVSPKSYELVGIFTKELKLKVNK